MTITNKDLKRRIIDISYKHKLSHIGSCLTAVDIIKEIYDIKKPDEKFVNDAGHSGIALYTVLEYNGGRDAEEIFLHHGIHPDRCKECNLDCSTGSLGQGIAIATGMALANRNKNVFCLVSDGGANEGSFWESLRVAKENNLFNLKIYLNANSWGAYGYINTDYLEQRIKSFGFPVEFRRTNVDYFPFLGGQEAHYISLTEETYKEAMRILK